MTDPTITLTDGTKNIPLVYDSGNQYAFKARYGSRVSPSESSPLWHNGDDTAPRLVALKDGNRGAFFEMIVKSTATTSKDDNILEALATLRLWIDGASQQAAQAEIASDAKPIYLKIQRKDSSTPTYHRVMYGFVDDSEAHYDAPSVLNNVAFNVVVYLTLAPYGQALSSISMDNYIINANFDFESVASGLAAAWTELSTPVTTLETDIKLFGMKSQKVIASAADQGVYSDAQISTETLACGYAWVYVISGTAQVQLYDVDAAAALDTTTIDATDSNGNSDKQKYDDGGRLWHRVPVSSNAVPALNSLSLRILSSGGAATFHINGAYLEIGTQTVPAAWCSCRTVYGRGDQTVVNPERVNTFDVWGVPGDAPAVMTLSTNVPAGTTVNISSWRDGYIPASQLTHWVESVALDSSGTDTNPSDAARTRGDYWRCAISSDDSIVCYASAPSAAAAREFYRRQRNVWVIARSSDASAVTFQDYGLLGQNKQLAADNTWEMIQVGSYGPREINEASTSTTIELFRASVVTAGAMTVDVDAVIVQYVDQNVMFSGNNSTYYLDGKTKSVYAVDSPYPLSPPPLGRLWHVHPDILNRFMIIHWNTTTGAHLLSEIYTFSVTVLPQTRHLLGAI